MLNFVPIPVFKSLGYGLDWRINHQVYREFAGDVMVVRKSNINNLTEQPISDAINTSYYYPTAPVSCEIVSDNAADTQTVSIFYYADTGDELPSVQQVTLTGTTPVAVPNDIYRGRRLVVSSPTGMNQGIVTLYEAGSPSNIISVMVPDIGYSLDSYIYFPPNTQAAFIKANILTNATPSKEFKVTVYTYPNGLAPTFKYRAQEYSVTEHQQWSNDSQMPITGPSIMEINCTDVSGSGGIDATIGYEFVLWKQ